METLVQVPRLVAFWSPGAAGATTVCAAVAAHLAHHYPGQVVAADFNLESGCLALRLGAYMGVSPADHALEHLLPLCSGGRCTPEAVSEYLLVPPANPGLSVLPGLGSPLHLPLVTEAVVLEILACLRHRFPVVLLDVSRSVDSTGAWPLLERADFIVAVGSPAPHVRWHLARYLREQETLGWASRLLLVLNRVRPPLPGLQAEWGRRPDVILPNLGDLSGLEEAGHLPTNRKFTSGVVALAERLLGVQAGPPMPQPGGVTLAER